MRRLFRSTLIAASLLAAAWIPAGLAADGSADPDPCTRFTWDVSQELALMQRPPQAVAAAMAPGAAIPTLRLGTLYELTLTDQHTVSFLIQPGKPTLDDDAQAGLLRFRTLQAGRYRVSITSGHWIDVTDGAQLLRSHDFQGQRGCQRPAKIVEYDLPGERDLTLQFSGATQSKVLVSITRVPATPPAT